MVAVGFDQDAKITFRNDFSAHYEYLLLAAKRCENEIGNYR